MKKPFLALVTLILLTSIVLANPLTDFTCSYFNLFCDNPPIIQKAYLNKEKFRPGEQMKITVAAKDDHKIKNVVAKIETENGTVETDMILIAGYKEDGTWQGKWKVHNVLYNRTYTTKVIVTDSNGQTTTKTLNWYDPVQSHPPSEIEPGSFRSGDYTFPGNLDIGGDLTVAGEIIGGGVSGGTGEVTFDVWNGSCSAKDYGSVSCSVTVPEGYTVIYAQKGTEKANTLKDIDATMCQYPAFVDKFVYSKEVLADMVFGCHPTHIGDTAPSGGLTISASKSPSGDKPAAGVGIYAIAIKAESTGGGTGGGNCNLVNDGGEDGSAFVQGSVSLSVSCPPGRVITSACNSTYKCISCSMSEEDVYAKVMFECRDSRTHPCVGQQSCSTSVDTGGADGQVGAYMRALCCET